MLSFHSRDNFQQKTKKKTKRKKFPFIPRQTVFFLPPKTMIFLGLLIKNEEGRGISLHFVLFQKSFQPTVGQISQKPR